MVCLPPQPLASPDAHTFEQSDRLVDVVALPVQGAEYVVRAGARGSAVTVVILVRGHAGLEQLATDVVAEGTIGRFTLPRVLAGAQLVVQAKGKVGASVALDIGWRPW